MSTSRSPFEFLGLQHIIKWIESLPVIPERNISSFTELEKSYPTSSHKGSPKLNFTSKIQNSDIIKDCKLNGELYDFNFSMDLFNNKYYFYITHKTPSIVYKNLHYEVAQTEIIRIHETLKKMASNGQTEECFNFINKEIINKHILTIQPEVSSEKKEKSKEMIDKAPSSVSQTKLSPQAKNVEPYVGILKIKDIDEHLGVATLVKEDTIITARHLVNEWSIDDLSFELSKDRTSTIAEVIEDGALSDNDYLVLRLTKKLTFDRYPNLALLNQITKFFLIRMDEKGERHHEAATFDTGSFYPVQVFSHITSAPGYCGSPYIDSDGNIFGMHIKASNGGMFDKEKTGILFDSLPLGPMRSLVEGVEPYETKDDKPKDNFFAYFSTAFIDLRQVDESEPLRITYKAKPTGGWLFEAEHRPGNQSGKKVQDRIKLRLQKLQHDGATLTEVQTRFLARRDHELKRNKIDIAHNIAINEIQTALVSKMNNAPPLDEAKERKAVTNFADAIASSDDEDDAKAIAINTKDIRRKLPNFVTSIRTKQNSPRGITEPEAKDLCKTTKKILMILNRCSRNLMPGHSSVNSSIQQSRDPHVTKVGAGYEETRTSKLLAKTAGPFLGKTYRPRTNSSNQIQSSSIDSGNNPDRAYYTPRR